MAKKDEKTGKQASPAKTPDLLARYLKTAKAEDGVVVTAKGSLDEAYSAQPEFSE